jgi:hexokinase
MSGSSEPPQAIVTIDVGHGHLRVALVRIPPRGDIENGADIVEWLTDRLPPDVARSRAEQIAKDKGVPLVQAATPQAPTP